MALRFRRRQNGLTRPEGTRLPWLETVLTAGVGLLLYFPLENPDLGTITWSVGALITVAQLKSESATGKQLAPVRRLAESMDLTQSTDVEQLRNLYQTYLKITEPEFAPLKSGVIQEAAEALAVLANDKISKPLSSGEYYSWLLPMVDSARPGAEIHALSLMMAAEWDDSPSERRFIEASKKAAARGVRVSRIFVTQEATMRASLANEAIKLHLSDEQPENIRGYFVDIDWLTSNDPNLRARLGEGFISFDERVALIDLFSPTGQARGQVNMNPSDLARLTTLYSQLEVHSVELSSGF